MSACVRVCGEANVHLSMVCLLLISLCVNQCAEISMNLIMRKIMIRRQIMHNQNSDGLMKTEQNGSKTQEHWLKLCTAMHRSFIWSIDWLIACLTCFILNASDIGYVFWAIQIFFSFVSHLVLHRFVRLLFLFEKSNFKCFYLRSLLAVYQY